MKKPEYLCLIDFLPDNSSIDHFRQGFGSLWVTGSRGDFKFSDVRLDLIPLLTIIPVFSTPPAVFGPITERPGWGTFLLDHIRPSLLNLFKLIQGLLECPILLSLLDLPRFLLVFPDVLVDFLFMQSLVLARIFGNLLSFGTRPAGLELFGVDVPLMWL